jgi:hypothetical protein
LRLTLSIGSSAGTSDDHGVSLDHPSDHKSLSVRRLEDFFDNKDFKSSLPHTWGLTDISSATHGMQTQLLALDRVLNANGSEIHCVSKQEDARYSQKNSG